MFSKFLRFITVSLVLVLVLSGARAWAADKDAVVDSTTPAGNTVIIHGHITDPSGAVIPGAKVTITNASGVAVSTTTADASGAYSLENLPAGSYYVQASYDGFAPFQSSLLTLTAGQSKHVKIVMAIEVAQQNVVVTDESSAVSVEAGANTDVVVLKGKDLDALSDDPDELSEELSALAGPSAGPNGGQIYIDGFSGGQLPPKSAIREIRINQNPFSAEFDRLGYGRIEILTKPGTDKLHGQIFVMGNDKSFNTSNPFTKTVPAYHSYQFNGTVSGALNNKTSFFLSAERRNQQSVNAWAINEAILPVGTAGTGNCTASGLYFVDCANEAYSVSLLSPHSRTNVSARIDYQLGARQTITARYGFYAESEHGNLSSGSLPSDSYHESNTDHTVQISDSIILNDHAVNEIRLQFERDNSNTYPDSTARTFSVSGDFTGGGYSSQTSRDHTTNLELWDITTLSHGPHAIKFGMRARDTYDANMTNANFNGSFTFDTAANYLGMANSLASGLGYNTTYRPTRATYTTGNKSTTANRFDVALFLQDDWKVNRRMTLSGGIRWEGQNHVADYRDWAPRLALAYALDGNGKDKKTKTVVRLGYGFFYDRLSAGNLLTVNRYNVQNKYVLNDPDCTTTATSLDGIDLSSCSGTSSTNSSDAPVKYEVANNFRAPVSEQFGASLERQIVPGTTLTLTYLHTFGVHQLVTRNANQASGGTPQTSSGGYLYQYLPEGVYKQNQAIVSINSKITKSISLMGSYTRNSANATATSISNAYDLNQDYGRASFVMPNMLFLMGSYRGPFGISFNPFLVAESGKPYNITLDTDTLNGLDNQRPAWATAAQCATNSSQYVKTSYGCFNVSPASTDSRIPVYMATGPAAVAFNMRISRSFGIGPKVNSGNNSTDGGGPGGPPPGGGRGPGGGGPGGGLGPGGFGSSGGRGPGGMFGSSANARKYSLNFSVQAMNLFNNINYGTPSGTIVSTQNSDGSYGPGSSFGRSTTLNQGLFATGSAARRVFGQLSFVF